MSDAKTIWLTPPNCPKCGLVLSRAGEALAPRGDWRCVGDHDGKRIWHDYELIDILRARRPPPTPPPTTASVLATLAKRFERRASLAEGNIPASESIVIAAIFRALAHDFMDEDHERLTGPTPATPPKQ